MYTFVNIFFVMITLVYAGCGRHSNDGASSLNWGHLEEVTGDSEKLIHAGPNDKIAICGINPEVTSWAVLTWAKSIGRAEAISKNIVPCDSGGAPYRVEVTAAEQGGAPAWTSGSRITVNVGQMGTEPNDFYKAILLHENGHVWGLCDQYASVDNCHMEHSSGQKDNGAVMGATSAGKQALTQDDVAGMTQLAQRGDVDGNQKWTSANLSQGGGVAPNLGTSQNNLPTKQTGGLPQSTIPQVGGQMDLMSVIKLIMQQLMAMK